MQGCVAAPASDSYAGAEAAGTGQQLSVLQVHMHDLQSSSVYSQYFCCCASCVLMTGCDLVQPALLLQNLACILFMQLIIGHGAGHGQS